MTAVRDVTARIFPVGKRRYNVKKSIKTLLAAALLLASVSPPALAAGELRAYVEKDYKEAVAVEANGADRISLAYSQAVNGRQYLATAQIEREDGEPAPPTEENLVYIDQSAASYSQVSFTIYPKTLEEGVVYGIYMSSNAPASDSGIRDYVRVAKFGLDLPADAEDATPGDANRDGKISALDASVVLSYVVNHMGETPDSSDLAAMDANRDGTISAMDASRILSIVVSQS